MNRLKISGIDYIAGYDKLNGGKAHLYRGTFEAPGEPMCPAGWNRSGGTDYSIIRGEAPAGICGDCWQNAKDRKSTIPRNTIMADKDNQYLKDRREQADREARGEGQPAKGASSTIGTPSMQATGTVTNPSDNASPSGVADAGETIDEPSVLGAGLAGSGLTEAPSGTPMPSGPGASTTRGGQTVTESATTGSQRSTEETGERFRR